MKLVPRSDRQQPWLTLWSASLRAVKKQKLKESRMTLAAKSDLNRFRREKKGSERRTLEEHLKEHFLQCLDGKAPHHCDDHLRDHQGESKAPEPTQEGSRLSGVSGKVAYPSAGSAASTLAHTSEEPDIAKGQRITGTGYAAKDIAIAATTDQSRNTHFEWMECGDGPKALSAVSQKGSSQSMASSKNLDVLDGCACACDVGMSCMLAWLA